MFMTSRHRYHYRFNCSNNIPNNIWTDSESSELFVKIITVIWINKKIKEFCSSDSHRKRFRAAQISTQSHNNHEKSTIKNGFASSSPIFRRCLQSMSIWMNVMFAASFHVLKCSWKCSSRIVFYSFHLLLQ